MPIPVQRTTTYPSGIHRFLSYNTSNTDFLAFCSSEPKEILKITDERIYTSNITVLGNIEFGADTGVLRNRIQVSPSRKVFYVDTSTQSVFNLSVEGIFGGDSSNADVCVNQNKLSYLNSNYADYDLTYAFTTGSNTDYTVTLTQAAVFGDIVDITLWPQLIQQSTPLSGYVYQGVSFTYFNKTTPTGSDIYYLGNVGIGTVLPLANLQIGATAQTAGSGTNYYNYAKQLALLGDYNVAPNSGDAIKLYIGNYNNDSAPNVYPILCEDENAYLDFFVKARATSALLPTMYFAGNIGIGTTAPTQALHVQGNALVTGNLTVTGSNITNINYINSIEYNSSNVIINNVSGAGPALKVSQTGVGASYPIADFYDNDVSTTIPAFRIADGGNVGIGTTVPTEKLHVNGYISATKNIVQIETNFAQAAATISTTSLTYIYTTVIQGNITPRSSTNKVIVEFFSGMAGGDNSAGLVFTLERSINAGGAWTTLTGGTFGWGYVRYNYSPIASIFIDTPATTNNVLYRIGYKQASGTGIATVVYSGSYYGWKLSELKA